MFFAGELDGVGSTAGKDPQGKARRSTYIRQSRFFKCQVDKRVAQRQMTDPAAFAK